MIKGRARTYVSKEAEAYKMEASLRSRLAGLRHPVDVPVQVHMQLCPKLTKKGKASEVCLDLDNTAKVVIDAMKGVAYRDDKQVHRLLIERAAPIEGGGLIFSIGEFVDGRSGFGGDSGAGGTGVADTGGTEGRQCAD